VFGYATGKEIQFKSSDCVARVCAAVNFENGAHDIAATREVLQFANNFGDDSTLTFIAHADADVGNEKAFKRSQRHMSSKKETVVFSCLTKNTKQNYEAGPFWLS
jgi:hypothetical protein